MNTTRDIWDQVAFATTDNYAASEVARHAASEVTRNIHPHAHGSATEPLNGPLLVAVLLNGGACAARDAFAVYAEYFNSLGELTFERAVLVSEVFTQALACRLARQWAGPLDAIGLRENLWLVLATSYGTATTERFEECRLMNLQFNHWRDNSEQKTSKSTIPWSVEQVMLLSLATRAAGGHFSWTLGPDALPVDDTFSLWAAGWAIPDGLPHTNVQQAMEFNTRMLIVETAMYAGSQAIQESRGTAESAIDRAVDRLEKTSGMPWRGLLIVSGIVAVMSAVPALLRVIFR